MGVTYKLLIPSCVSKFYKRKNIMWSYFILEDTTRIMSDCHYTKYCIICHQSYLSCSILTVDRPCSVTNTKWKPNIICHSLWMNLGTIDLQCYKNCHLLRKLSTKIQSSMTIFHYRNVRMHNTPNCVAIIGIWMNITCKLIHKKCH